MAPRERWASRTAFLFAAIGSAVGLGNIWRFPHLSYRHGGGAFLVPYFISLVVIGMPTLFLELALGMSAQAGDVEAFGSISPRLRGIGVGSIFAGFMIISYYSCIISWTISYFVSSLMNPPPWSTGQPEDFLYGTVMRLQSTGPPDYAPAASLDSAVTRSLSGYVVGGLVLSWLSTYFCIWQGVKSASRVVMVTMPLPILIILGLMVHHLTLDGSADGIRAYIGEWRALQDTPVPILGPGGEVIGQEIRSRPGGNFLDALSEPAAWSDAAGQIFFTLSVSMGVMTAYGSYRHPESDMVLDHIIITAVNTSVSILAGLAVFAILGHLAWVKGENIWDIGGTASISLVFITYPAGLATFSSATTRALGAVFFLCLFALGIDSLFSIVEGVTTVIHDTPLFNGYSRESISAATCGAALLFSLLYASDQGLWFLDVIDHYINNYALFFVAGFESYAASWCYGWTDLVQRVGKQPARILTVGYTAGAAIGIVLCGALTEVDNLRGDSYNILIGVLTGLFIFLASYLASFLSFRTSRPDLAEHPGGTWGWFLAATFFTGTEKLREKVNSQGGNMKIPKLWDVLVKYVNPALLCALCVNTALADAKAGGYGGGIYPDWIQCVGGLAGALALLPILAFIIWPDCGWWGSGRAPQGSPPPPALQIAPGPESPT